MKTLAIETSCDDTSLALVNYNNGVFSVEKLLAYSQIADHQQYGGVVPEIAFRLHSEHILALTQKFSEELPDVDSISVTTNPGLAGSLLVGKTVAYILGKHYNKPVVPVHHIYGHIFSLLLERNITELQFPWIVLTASGGHNEIYLVNLETGLRQGENKVKSSGQTLEVLYKETGLKISLSDFTITKLGKTLDDAAGECFDKVARMLGGPYPGGQWISEQALKGKPNPEYRFKRVLLGDHDNSYDFSFSGMKSQAYNLLQKLGKTDTAIEGQILYDIAYEFQEAIVDTLVYKLGVAIEQYKPETIGIVGGVSANDRLYEQANATFSQRFGKQVLRPTKKVYSTDNGAMIGVVGLLS